MTVLYGLCRRHFDVEMSMIEKHVVGETKHGGLEQALVD